MENPDQCRLRAAKAREEAEDPSTTSLMRQRLLESAQRWEEMADDAEAFERERIARENEARARVLAQGKKPSEPRVRKRWKVADAESEELPVLVLTKRMIRQPESEAA